MKKHKRLFAWEEVLLIGIRRMQYRVFNTRTQETESHKDTRGEAIKLVNQLNKITEV